MADTVRLELAADTTAAAIDTRSSGIHSTRLCPCYLDPFPVRYVINLLVPHCCSAAAVSLGGVCA